MARGEPSLKRKLTFSLLAFILFVGGVECLLRLANHPPAIYGSYRTFIRGVDNDLRIVWLQEDPDLFWSPRPGYAEGDVSINALGMRDGPVAVPKPAGRLRVLCLGDSVTWGWKVDLHETWVKVLERRLCDAFGAGGVEVLNMGVTGYTSFQGLQYLRLRGALLEPDLVIACFGHNDSLRRLPFEDREIFDQSPASLRLSNLAHGSNIYRLLRSYIVAALPRQRRQCVRRVPPARFAANSVALAKLAGSLGARSLFMTYPHVSASVEGWNDGHHYENAMREAARIAGAPLVRLQVLSLDTPPTNRRYFLAKDPVHPNAIGHSLIAERLAARILGDGLLGKPPRGRRQRGQPRPESREARPATTTVPVGKP